LITKCAPGRSCASAVDRSLRSTIGCMSTVADAAAVTAQHPIGRVTVLTTQTIPHAKCTASQPSSSSFSRPLSRFARRTSPFLTPNVLLSHAASHFTQSSPIRLRAAFKPSNNVCTCALTYHTRAPLSHPLAPLNALASHALRTPFQSLAQ
jgi:hypothetical protein